MGEMDEKTLEYARNFKKYLRFDIGDIVFSKADLHQKCPMMVKRIFALEEDQDYLCEWLSSSKSFRTNDFLDKHLVCQK